MPELLSDVICPICTDVLSKPTSTCCGHSFCSECWAQYVANASATEPMACPICRKQGVSVFNNYALTAAVHLLKLSNARAAFKEVKHPTPFSRVFEFVHQAFVTNTYADHAVLLFPSQAQWVQAQYMQKHLSYNTFAYEPSTLFAIQGANRSHVITLITHHFKMACGWHDLHTNPLHFGQRRFVIRGAEFIFTVRYKAMLDALPDQQGHHWSKIPCLVVVA